MYRSIYPYTTQDPGLLNFNTGDVFNLIEQVDAHWWSVHDEKGRHGLVPATYLEVNSVGEEGVLRSLDKCIESISKNSVRGKSSLNEEERRILQKLVKNRQIISEGNSLWSKNTTSPPKSPSAGIPQQPKRRAPKAPVTPTPEIKNSSNRRSLKKMTAPPPPPPDAEPLQRSKSIGSTTSKTSSTSSLEDEGASSKIYNIVVNNGASLLPISPTQKLPDSASKSASLPLSAKGTTTIVAGLQATNFTVAPSCSSHSSRTTARPISNNAVTSGSRTISTTSSTTSSSVKSAKSNVEVCLGNTKVLETLGPELVDIVRSRCKLSFNKSLDVVRVVLNTLSTQVPDIKVIMEEISLQITDDKLLASRGTAANEDASRLQEVLDRLTEHKEDSQQRNWAVHEDFEVIKELLDSLLKILSEMDPNISRTVLRDDEYRYINDLIIYFQMENRSKLRVALLHVFGCFCELGAEFVSQILCSVLPTELAMDIMQDQKDIMKLLTSCLVLTMLFSTGEPVPYNHYVQFNNTFVNFVLDTIENPPSEDVEDQVPDALMGVLLAFNQHFKTPRNNIVLQCIAQRQIFRTLSEKVLLLVNRETDPVAMFDFVQSVPDSVMKFLIDLFSSDTTSGIFFTNDLMVLIDIILRQIKDRSEKDKTRTEYLSLFHSLLNTTNYNEHRHLVDEFKRCFQDILMNSELESEVDLYIVREITNRFSDLFL